MEDTTDLEGPSALVLNVKTPPWYVPYDPSKPQYGSVRELEAKVAAISEGRRLAYKEKYPESYAKWQDILTEDAKVRFDIHNAPSVATAKTAAAIASGVLSPVLAERIEGADRQEAARVKRAAMLAKKAAEDAKRRELVPPM